MRGETSSDEEVPVPPSVTSGKFVLYDTDIIVERNLGKSREEYDQLQSDEKVSQLFSVLPALAADLEFAIEGNTSLDIPENLVDPDLSPGASISERREYLSRIRSLMEKEFDVDADDAMRSEMPFLEELIFGN